MQVFRALIPALLSAGFVFGQASPAPQFEVASVKPSTPGAYDQVQIGVHVDGARVTANDLNLRDYIRMAYRVKDYQISGPEWMGSERYDISATLPEGATQSQVPDMIKALLADRFKMQLHHETRDFPVYALILGKGPLKLVESPLDADSGVPGKAPVNVAVAGSRAGVNIDMGHGAFFSFANNKLEARKLTTAVLAEMLARFVDKPVVDMTGLTGTYNLSLDFTEEDYRAMLIRSAINAGVVLPPEARRLMESASGDSLFTAMQSAGLKLDSRKAPLDVLVIDKADKTPSAN